MKGGLYHLNQVLMAYNSNRIEGSRLDEEQTRYIYETRTITGENVAVDDVVEAVNSFECSKPRFIPFASAHGKKKRILAEKATVTGPRSGSVVPIQHGDHLDRVVGNRRHALHGDHYDEH